MTQPENNEVFDPRTMKPTISCSASVIKQLREAGAEVEKIYMKPGRNYGEKITYTASRRKHKGDYLLGSVAYTDNHDFVHLIK